MKKFTIVMIILDILVAGCFVLVYGVQDFKYKIIATALSTKTHGYIAYTFYDEDTINEVMAATKYIQVKEDVNLDDIVIDPTEKDSYDNKYDEKILTRDPGNEDYKYIKVDVGGYTGHLIAVYNPAKIKLIASKSFNTGYGQETIMSMCERNNGLVCINGGRFNDTTGWGSDIPVGTLIKDSKIIWSDSNDVESIIGFNKDNKLVLIKATAEDAVKKHKIRDGLQFGPFLIVNGKKIKSATSAGGYDRAARVAIGQRKDGIVLFLVTEGVHTNGPNLLEVADLLEKYGAHNAANLDGGTSSQLIIKGKLMNSPKTIYGQVVTNGRAVVSGWGLLK